MFRIVFFGTPQFAVPFVNALREDARFEIAAIVAQPDAPVGRKQVLTAPPTAQYAKEHNIPLLQPETLTNNKTLQVELKNYAADAFVVIAYGKIIPKSLLQIPPRGIVNIHPSLLPKYRGPSPMQAALQNGDEETGISIMLIDKEMDHGPLLTQISIPLTNDVTIESLESLVHEKGTTLLRETLVGYLEGVIQPKEQDHEKASYCHLLSRKDGYIKPQDTLETVRNKWRAYYPWPGVTCATEDGKVYKIHAVDKCMKNPSNANELSIESEGSRLFLKNKQGSLEILRIQEEGRTAVSSGDFIRGLPSQRIQVKLKEMS